MTYTSCIAHIHEAVRGGEKGSTEQTAQDCAAFTPVFLHIFVSLGGSLNTTTPKDGAPARHNNGAGYEAHGAIYHFMHMQEPPEVDDNLKNGISAIPVSNRTPSALGSLEDGRWDHPQAKSPGDRLSPPPPPSLFDRFFFRHFFLLSSFSFCRRSQLVFFLLVPVFSPAEISHMHMYIHSQLALLGQPVWPGGAARSFSNMDVFLNGHAYKRYARKIWDGP